MPIDTRTRHNTSARDGMASYYMGKAYYYMGKLGDHDQCQLHGAVVVLAAAYTRSANKHTTSPRARDTIASSVAAVD